MLLLIVLAALATAFATGWLLIRFEGLHAHLSHDAADAGPQKFHTQPTPRIGGVPVACGLIAGLLLSIWSGTLDYRFVAAYGLSVLPAFASGLTEDLTKRIGPDLRLWASFLSALVAIYFFDAVVSRSGLPGIDNLLLWYPFALVFTMVGVGGVAHALNLVDGYNGLASGVTLLMFGAFAYVAWRVGDTELLTLCLILAAATAGFFFWNFPGGRIFAGDGGAYLWGVSAGLVSILLIHRHREVSPWFPLAVMIYPVFETLFSIYRRKLLHAAAAGQPDAKHLHQLIYRRLLSPHRIDRTVDATRRNAATSPFLWTLCALSVLPATLFYRDTGALIAIVIGFALVYVWLYRSIVRLSVARDLRRLGRLALRWASAPDTNQPTEIQNPPHQQLQIAVGDAANTDP